MKRMLAILLLLLPLLAACTAESPTVAGDGPVVTVYKPAG